MKLGPRVAVIGGGNTAIDCAREALRQGAEEVTMITVEATPSEMPCVPEDLHDMLEEGVELMHGRAMTAVLGNGKVEALQLHPARFSGAINASPITVDREAPAERFAVDNVIIAVGQHASLEWLPDEFKTERGTIKIDRFGRLGDTMFFAAGDIVQLGSGQPLMVVNAVGDGKRVAFNLDKVLRGEPLQERMVPIDVITDLARMNMTYFPKFPRVQQAMLPPASRRRTQDEVIQAFTEEQAIEEANRCFSCGTCNACDNCYLVCPEPCIVRSDALERPLQDSGGLLQRLPRVHRGVSDGLSRGRARAGLRHRRRADGHGVRDHAGAARTAGGGAEESAGPSGEGHRELAYQRCGCGCGANSVSPLGRSSTMMATAVATKEEESPDQRLRRVGAGRQVRRRRRDHGLSDPALHGDDDGAGADGGERRARRRVHRGRQRALAVEHRARRLVERRARVHRQLGRRRAVRVRALLADLGHPHAGADDDRRPHARSARRLRVRAHRRALDARHGLAHGLVVRRAGSVRQSSARRTGSARIPRVLLPQMVCQDGFFVSHITTDVELPDTGQVKEFLPPYKHPYPLDPRRPVSHGPQIMPEQGPPLQLERARAMEGAVPVIEQAHEEFARIFGRRYDSVDRGIS